MSDSGYFDRLVFALDGDAGSIENAFAEVDAGAAKTSKNVQDSLGKAFSEAGKGAKQYAVDTKASLDATASSARQTGAVWETTQQSITRSLNLNKADTKSAADSWKTFGGAIGDVKTPAQKLREEFDHVGNNINVSRREMIYFGRELVNGDFQRLPATVALLASHILEIPAATLAMGAAIVAVPAALITAAFQAEEAFSRVEVAIKRTGNAAGVTTDQIRQIAYDTNASGLSERGKLDSMSILLGRGNVGAGVGQSLLPALAGFSTATGSKQDEASKKLEELFADPAKGADELNAEFKLLDASTTRQIQHLEEQGRLQDAQTLLAQAVNDRFDGLEKSAFSLSNLFDGVGKALSNAWFHTGEMVTGNMHPGGGPLTDQDRLQQLKDRLQQGNIPVGTAGTYGGYLPQSEGDRASLTAQITALQKKIDDSDKAAKAAGSAAETNRRAAAGAKLGEQYDKEAGVVERLGDQHYLLRQGLEAQEAQLRKMQAEAKLPLFPGMRAALDAKIAEQQKMIDATKFGFTGVDLAGQNQRTPAQIAAEAATDTARIARAAPRQQSELRERLAAQRTYESNAANPEMAPYAADIRTYQLSTAGVAEHARREQTLKDMAEHNRSLKAEADAYGTSATAAERAKIAGMAHEAYLKGATDDAKKYADALREGAYEQERLGTAQRVHALSLSNAGLERQVQANGSPAGLQAAARTTQAIQETDKLFIEAGDDAKKLAEAERARADVLKRLTQQDELREREAFNTEVFGVKQSIAAQQFRGQAMGGGLTPDDQRHIDVAIRTFDDLVHQGLDPTKEEFKRQFDILNPLNERLSDMSDAIQEAARAAKEYANDVTGGIKSWVMGGGKGGVLGLGDAIGQNMLGTALDQALKPVNDELTKQFGNILGVPTGTKPDGSLANPYSVIVQNAGGLGGLGGGSGGIGDLFSKNSDGGGMFDNLFGGDSTSPSFMHSLFGGGAGEANGGGDFIGTAADSGGFFGNLLSMVGLASGGAMDPSKYYMIGENGPEIWGPGHAGTVTPLAQTRGGSVGGGSNAGQSSGGTNINMNFHGVTDMPSIVRSKSQIESMVTGAAARGQRNK